MLRCLLVKKCLTGTHSTIVVVESRSGRKILDTISFQQNHRLSDFKNLFFVKIRRKFQSSEAATQEHKMRIFMNN